MLAVVVVVQIIERLCLLQVWAAIQRHLRTKAAVVTAVLARRELELALRVLPIQAVVAVVVLMLHPARVVAVAQVALA
jgi:hypothetical protein